jgi:hypothetical protein
MRHADELKPLDSGMHSLPFVRSREAYLGAVGKEWPWGVTLNRFLCGLRVFYTADFDRHRRLLPGDAARLSSSHESRSSRRTSKRRPMRVTPGSCARSAIA